MSTIHKGLSSSRWQEMTLYEQMGNIGSEVDRVVSWLNKNNRPYAESALFRAIELLDMTITDKRWAKGRKELLRTREILCDMFIGDNQYNISYDWIRKYFFQYALAARIKK